MAAERGRRPASRDDDDVIDPSRLRNDVYAQSSAQITSAMDVIIKTSANYFDLKKWRHIATLRLSRARPASASDDPMRTFASLTSHAQRRPPARPGELSFLLEA